MESVVHVRVRTNKLAAFRLALYDPCEPDDSLEFCGPVFADTPFDKMVMRLVVEKYNRRLAPKLPFCLAIFPWEGDE